jgi:predicted ribosome quality control (RQC) complex YloA/Tae2 family protein
VVGRSARSTDAYLSDALDRLIEMAAEDTPLLEAEEDALAILAEHFHIHKLLENVKYAGKGAMGWPTYFAKRPVRLTPAGQLLVNHALWAATLNVEEAEEELAARAGKCRERLLGLKRRGPCIGALCPLFAHCLRKLARETSSLELPAKTKRKLEKTASKIENHYEKLLKELEETLQKAQ